MHVGVSALHDSLLTSALVKRGRWAHPLTSLHSYALPLETASCTGCVFTCCNPMTDVGADEWRHSQLWTPSIDALLGQCKPRLETLFKKMAGCLEPAPKKGMKAFAQQRNHYAIMMCMLVP